MTIRPLWILLAGVIAAIARPALAQYNWSDVGQAVATAHLSEDERTELLSATAEHTGPRAQEPPYAVPAEWAGIASITLDRHGQMTKGYAEVRDNLTGWDYRNDPVWLQSAACQQLSYNIGLSRPQPGAEIEQLPVFTCMDYQRPPSRYTSALGLIDFEALYGTFVREEAETPLAAIQRERERMCNELRGRRCEEGDSPPDSRAPDAWGVSIGQAGRAETFVRVDHDGSQHITHVIWAE